MGKDIVGIGAFNSVKPLYFRTKLLLLNESLFVFGSQG